LGVISTPTCADSASGGLPVVPLRRVHESYADAAHALQVARLGCGLTKLATQPRQVYVDRAVGAAVVLLPHLGQQGPLADDLAGALGQSQQQVELTTGERELLSVEGRGTGRLVDEQVTYADRLG